MQTLDWLYQNRSYLLLEAISGSRAYGLHTPQSDTDIKGVYCLPAPVFYGLDYTNQLNNDTNDIVYYELKRFIELLLKNNPTILELLSTPEDCLLHRHEIMKEIKPEMFLSRICQASFAGYADAQIKKSKGANKKLNNPLPKERKDILDFCYVIQGYTSRTLKSWLEENGFVQEDCGLVAITHFRDVYALFHSSQLSSTSEKFRGIYSGEKANEVVLSHIPKGIEPLCIVNFNKDGYSTYCKEYREYWNWVEIRNEDRYAATLAHGKNYDAKNMMHVFRLLTMAEEIALHKKIIVRRPDRDFLLKIRSGEFEYQYLLDRTEEKMERMSELFDRSDLPEEPDKNAAESLLISMRERLYKR